ncbi:MAG: ABC transporter substrate-binding protein [Coriobacteriales bacterium]|jgi:iron complex transport system substrate-binding protein|nr:ABC transporter substrate-binding protein [Coriobacteriales bacterium]
MSQTQAMGWLRRMASCALAVVLCLGLFACSTPKAEDTTANNDSPDVVADSGRTVIDLAGRSVTVPTDVEHAAAVAGPSYEKVFLLGQADRLAGIHFVMIDRPWVVETNPNVSQLTAIESPGEPNVEGLIELGADVVLFFDYEEPLAAMEAAGLPVVVVQNSTGNPTTADEFIEYQKQEVQVFADTFGADAQAKAAAWIAYFDEKVAYVQERVGSIPDAERKTAVYAYGEEGLGVFSTYSYPSFWLELAGGRNIADESGAEMDTEVTMEQMIAWDPDYIFMGRMDSTEAVTGNAAWAEMSAVQQGNVYLCPDGVMFWDYSSEGVLLMEYLAQKMYPELFADLDMVAEVQDYYETFYNYDLSAENAQRILDHLGPA